MTVKWKNHLIKSYDYGFLSQKRIGNQWKVIGYYTDLDKAVSGLFTDRVLNETINYIVEAEDAEKAKIQTANLLKKIKTISSDIRRGLNHDNITRGRQS